MHSDERGSEEWLYPNGVNGLTGQYLLPPLSYPQAAGLIKGQPPDRGLLSSFRRLLDSLHHPHAGLPQDVDPADFRQAGWGVVFPAAADSSLRAALQPLIEHRLKQVDQGRSKVLDYRPGESWRAWLRRHDVLPGSVEPEKVPYYLLLVGGPEEIPFNFQYLLDVGYAVGRVAFDSPEDYRCYALSVCAYETAAQPPHGRQAVFFAPRHDRATQLSADRLVAPLAAGRLAPAGQTGFTRRAIIAEAATKSELSSIFCPPLGSEPPAFLFSAGHGLGWPKGHTEQAAGQGALVCQDWPGAGGIRPDHYYAAGDLPAAARIHGLVAFLFACYGAGSPQHDSFSGRAGSPPPVIAERPFVAALPRRLLAHPAGGALAVIGHIDRAWGGWLAGGRPGAPIPPFENAVGRILAGQPVGYAVKDFNDRYAELSTGLSELLEKAHFNAEVPDGELVSAWTERNDAQNYVILGDPAARLRLEGFARDS